MPSPGLGEIATTTQRNRAAARRTGNRLPPGRVSIAAAKGGRKPKAPVTLAGKRSK